MFWLSYESFSTIYFDLKFPLGCFYNVFPIQNMKKVLTNSIDASLFAFIYNLTSFGPDFGPIYIRPHTLSFFLLISNKIC